MVVLLCILFVLVIVYLLLIPVVFGFLATRPANKDVEGGLNGFDDVTILTDDSLKLSGWYKKPSSESKAAILILHGAGETRDSLKDHINIFSDTDYGVLAIDARGHGESQGGTNKFCWECGKDVKAAVKFLKDHQVENIGALGLSMGGEVILGSAYENPEIQAIVADGATYRFYQEFRELPEYSGILGLFSPVLVTDYSTRLFSGENPPKTILESISNSDASFLFIGAGQVADEVKFNSFYAQETSPNSTLYIISDCGHTNGLRCEEEKYSDNVLNFFYENLE